MKWLKILGGVVLLLVLALAAVPFFVSLDDYIPHIEREVSARIKEPVKIGSLRAAGLPFPHVTVSGVTVGGSSDVKLGKVTVTPDLWSLMSPTKVVKSIEIEGLDLTQRAVDKIPTFLPPPGKPGAPAQAPLVRIGSIKLENALVRLQKATIGPFDARLELDGDGNPVSASLLSRDGKLKAEIKPGRTSYAIEIQAKDWTVPVGHPIHFDELAVKGTATMNDANLGDIRARLYGGTVTGKLTAAWQKGLQTQGSAEINQVEIAPVLKALSRPLKLSGKVTAKPATFSASAANPDQLVKALRAESPFSVQDGVLHGVDIRKAATALINRDGGKGGETRFSHLSGHLALDRGTRRLTQLKVVSGSLAGDGHVTVSPADELSGRVTARFQADSIAAAAVQLNVTGTLDAPLLYPTRGTVAGAAVGTAVAGPLGTGVGAKVGQWAEGVLGKKKAEKKK